VLIGLRNGKTMSKTRRLFWSFIVAVLTLSAVCYGSLWAYDEYEAYRAKSMLAELSLVKIGDPEASILAVTTRYGGFKWIPEPLSPRENWIDKEEYAYEVTRQSDYKYELGLSPFGTTVAHSARLARALRSAKEVIPERLRPLLGLRDWGITAEFSIRGGRVYAVSAMTLFEGRCEWLGHKWELASDMPRFGMPAREYAIGAAHLTMWPNGGEMITNFYTSRASDEEVATAQSFNPKCLTSVRGCDGFCDAAPRPLAYLRQHADAVWNIIPPRCNEQ
jgi:hypothetical protein